MQQSVKSRAEPRALWLGKKSLVVCPRYNCYFETAAVFVPTDQVN